MQTTPSPETNVNVAETSLPKWDRTFRTRLDDDGLRQLQSLARENFMDPATYGRKVLLEHVRAVLAARSKSEAAA
jgi:hypothetical protein